MPIIFSDLHKGVVINTEREFSLRNQVVDRLPEIGINLRFNSPLTSLQLQYFISILFHAVQNVYDHANRTPIERLASRVPVDSFLWIDIDDEYLLATVSDTGVGLSIRQSQDITIHTGYIEEEMNSFDQALEVHQSAKLRAGDCRIRGVSGFGFTYIQHYLSALKAHATLRSGRCVAHFGFNRFIILAASDDEFHTGTTLEIKVPLNQYPQPEPFELPF